MHVRRIAAHIHPAAFFVKAGFLVDLAVEMQVIDTLCDQISFCVVPGATADAVARIDYLAAVQGGGAEVGAPGAIAGTGRSGQRLTVLVRAREAAEVGALAGAYASDEKAHFGRGLLCRLLCVGNADNAGSAKRACDQGRNFYRVIHDVLLIIIGRSG